MARDDAQPQQVVLPQAQQHLHVRWSNAGQTAALSAGRPRRGWAAPGDTARGGAWGGAVSVKAVMVVPLFTWRHDRGETFGTLGCEAKEGNSLGLHKPVAQGVCGDPSHNGGRSAGIKQAKGEQPCSLRVDLTITDMECNLAPFATLLQPCCHHATRASMQALNWSSLTQTSLRDVSYR